MWHDSSSIRCRAFYSLCRHTVAYVVELFVCGFLQCVAGCIAVDGVYHHLLWANLLKRFNPGRYVAVGRVVEVLAVYVGSLHKHSLDDDVAVE